MSLFEQEAQLSQRDRSMLRVTEYFAKSLKVSNVLTPPGSWYSAMDNCGSMRTDEQVPGLCTVRL